MIVVAPFADDRGMQRCGMQKNGYNMDTADAVCQGDPGTWLATLLANELRTSGFTAGKLACAMNPSTDSTY